MFSFLNPATRITCGHTTRRITRRSYILKKRRRRTQYRQHQAMKIWMAMMSTLLACRVLSLEVDLHIANEMHRDLEAALRMNFIRIDAVCNQLVGEVQHQRVLAGKDLELYVKYGQTRRFQIDSQMKISTLLSHIAAEFELDRDPEEEEKYDTQFEAEAHIKIQVNGLKEIMRIMNPLVLLD